MYIIYIYIYEGRSSQSQTFFCPVYKLLGWRFSYVVGTDNCVLLLVCGAHFPRFCINRYSIWRTTGECLHRTACWDKVFSEGGHKIC